MQRSAGATESVQPAQQRQPAAARRPQQPHRGLVLCLRCRSSHPSACCCVGRRSPWSSREWRHAGGGVALQCTTTIPYRRANGIAQGPNRTPIESTVAVASSSAAQRDEASATARPSSPIHLVSARPAKSAADARALHRTAPLLRSFCFFPFCCGALLFDPAHPFSRHEADAPPAAHTHTHNTYSHTHSPLHPSVG